MWVAVLLSMICQSILSEQEEIHVCLLFVLGLGSGRIGDWTLFCFWRVRFDIIVPHFSCKCASPDLHNCLVPSPS